MEDWLSQHFVNSSLVAGGAALISVPIIIHLINRLRFKRVKWAAMEFLLKSRQKSRRRVLLEQLLLLFLRICAVAALAALIARPILPKDLPLFGGQEIQHVILIDDSGSMRDQLGETTAFEEATKIAKEIAAAGERRPEIHKLTLMIASDPSQPVFTMENLDSEFLAVFQSRLETLNCSHRRLPVIDAVQAAERILKDQKGSVVNFHFLSDFRDPDWAEDGALAGAVHDLAAAGISTNLVKTVAERHANLAVTGLTGQLQIAAANVPLRMKVKITNFGEQMAENIRIALYIDGKKLPRNLVVVKLNAEETAEREFDVLFPQPGPHDIHAQVVASDDALSADDSRFLTVDVSDSHPLLVIDGHVNRGDVDYLRDALEPAPGITGYDVIAEEPDYLRRHPLARFRNIVLMNVAQLPADSIRFLEEYVAAGGGLAWFMGDQIRPSFYNESLYRGGQGLFPVPLTTIKELSTAPEETISDLKFEEHPLFVSFEGQDNPFLQDVRVTRYFAIDEKFEPGPQTRVIGRFRNNAPAFIEQQFGRGRVVTFLSSCGPAWNNWARNPSYVILQLELQKYLAESGSAVADHVVGELITLDIDPALHTGEVEIQLPAEGGGNVVRLRASDSRQQEAADGTKSNATAVTSPADTDFPGIYTVTRFHRDKATDVERIGFNFPVGEESSLDPAETDTIKTRIGNDVDVHVHEVGATGWVDGEEAGQELRNWLLCFLLFVLLAEQLLARKLSYHPSKAAASQRTEGVQTSHRRRTREFERTGASA